MQEILENYIDSAVGKTEKKDEKGDGEKKPAKGKKK